MAYAAIVKKNKGRELFFTNQLEVQRVEKAEALKAIGKNPYRHNTKRDINTSEFKKKFAYIDSLEEKKDDKIILTLVGRIKFLRWMGKAVFAKIEDEDDALQIYFNKEALGEEWFNHIKKLLDVGDIVQVRGYPFITKTGELSLHTTDLEIAAKSITPLPEKFHGLQDKELRYRQRYLDIIMNPEVKQTFKARSKIISTIRKFFEEHGFLEVETPMMHPIPGGANAKPFVTFHNALGVERYLRIAPELYLKRLIVGGFNAVFEINRNFRNEGLDLTHNPEFTSIEFYWAHHNYKDLMDLTEKLLHALLKTLELPEVLPYDDKTIDFSKPFERISHKEALVKIGGIDPLILNDKKAIEKKIREDGFDLKPNLNLGQLRSELFDNYVEEKLINPTFITEYPIEISPLSRKSDEDESIAERFELFIAGSELANGFNELNDPLDQHARFTAQLEAKAAGDDEAHEMDEDYIKALGYGFAPTAGEGLGIDRLVMLLTNQTSIRDVLLFPAMKQIKPNDKQDDEGDDE
ncbi:MAG: lysine--tRNA ligase [Campylobacteraceae bacterium]|jgi:lysyl-tRNA synthetase class 2|nr:lysine--tRNA ligase [Campylobacteraceae bacterium]